MGSAYVAEKYGEIAARFLELIDLVVGAIKCPDYS